MAELSALLDKLDAETRAELDTIETGTPDLERQLRAAATACETEDRAATLDTADKPADTDRAELRAACSLTRYMLGAGSRQSGAEAELQAELGLNSNQIPLEMLASETRAAEADPEKRADATPAPSTVGVNLDVLRPRGVRAERLLTGSCSKCRWSNRAPTPQQRSQGRSPRTLYRRVAPPAATYPKPSAAFTPSTTTPHRVGGSLVLSVEDIAAVGAAQLRERFCVRTFRLCCPRNSTTSCSTATGQATT